MRQPAFYRRITQNSQRYTEEVEHRYGEIDVPMLILWGQGDEWIPIETGPTARSTIEFGISLHSIGRPPRSGRSDEGGR